MDEVGQAGGAQADTGDDQPGRDGQAGRLVSFGVPADPAGPFNPADIGPPISPAWRAAEPQVSDHSQLLASDHSDLLASLRVARASAESNGSPIVGRAGALVEDTIESYALPIRYPTGPMRDTNDVQTSDAYEPAPEFTDESPAGGDPADVPASARFAAEPIRPDHEMRPVAPAQRSNSPISPGAPAGPATGPAHISTEWTMTEASMDSATPHSPDSADSTRPISPAPTRTGSAHSSPEPDARPDDGRLEPQDFVDADDFGALLADPDAPSRPTLAPPVWQQAIPVQSSYGSGHSQQSPLDQPLDAQQPETYLDDYPTDDDVYPADDHRIEPPATVPPAPPGLRPASSLNGSVPLTPIGALGSPRSEQLSTAHTQRGDLPAPPAPPGLRPAQPLSGATRHGQYAGVHTSRASSRAVPSPPPALRPATSAQFGPPSTQAGSDRYLAAEPSAAGDRYPAAEPSPSSDRYPAAQPAQSDDRYAKAEASGAGHWGEGRIASEHSASQGSTLQRPAVQYSAAPYPTPATSTVQPSTVQPSTVQHVPSQNAAAQSPTPRTPAGVQLADQSRAQAVPHQATQQSQTSLPPSRAAMTPPGPDLPHGPTPTAPAPTAAPARMASPSEPAHLPPELSETLPHRVPAAPDVPDMQLDDEIEDYEVDLAPEAGLDGPELTRIASRLRHEAPAAPLPDELDITAVLAAARHVPGVANAQLRANPGGVHTLRLDLAEGADPGRVSRQVARLLKERMGLAAEPRRTRADPVVTQPTASQAAMNRSGLSPALGPPAAAAAAGMPRAGAPDASHLRAAPASPGRLSPGGQNSGPGQAGGQNSVAGQASGGAESSFPGHLATGGQNTMTTGGQNTINIGGQNTMGAPTDVRRDQEGGRAPRPSDRAQRPATLADVASGVEGLIAEPSRHLGQTPRVIVDQVRVSTLGSEATVEVRLLHNGVPSVGAASGPGVDGYLLRLAAQAAAGAIDGLIEASGTAPHLRCFIDHAGVVPFGSCVVAVVVVLVSGEGWVEQLVGSALVASDPRQAIVRATLAAMNRRLESLLA